jgi:hypothetical protein
MSSPRVHRKRHAFGRAAPLRVHAHATPRHPAGGRQVLGR